MRISETAALRVRLGNAGCEWVLVFRFSLLYKGTWESALISEHPELFEILREQLTQGQVSIAKKSQAQSPLTFADTMAALH
jgi:hypothetical protein